MRKKLLWVISSSAIPLKKKIKEKLPSSLAVGKQKMESKSGRRNKKFHRPNTFSFEMCGYLKSKKLKPHSMFPPLIYNSAEDKRAPDRGLKVRSQQRPKKRMNGRGIKK